MVAWGVTCNACYVECKGRKGFLNWYGNCTLLTPKISPVSVILLNVCSFGFFYRDWKDFCKWIGWCDFSPCFCRVNQKIFLHFPLQLHSKTIAITQLLLCLKGLKGVSELFSVFQTVKHLMGDRWRTFASSRPTQTLLSVAKVTLPGISTLGKSMFG